ncbi:unnamed protein product [Musa textilis]
MTYEMTCHAHEELENPLLKNRKDIILRTQEDHLKESSSDEDLDDELALLIQKFKKFIRNKFKNDTKNKFEPKKEQVICYECKKLGHFKSECPQAKKKQPKKKKALKATWDDSSSSEDEEASNKEVANFALMVLGDKVCELFNENLTFDELSIAFHELFDECKAISKSLIY